MKACFLTWLVVQGVILIVDNLRKRKVTYVGASCVKNQLKM